MSKVHDVASAGFAEGTNELYDRARPSYPSDAVAHIHQSLPPNQSLTVIEPGSGTGIFSRLLLSPPAGYPSWDLKKLIAVEPSEGMRRQWDKGLAPIQLPQGVEAKTVAGGFDDLSHAGVKPGEADLIVIAQAFHWCPDHEAAMREFGKYLSPNGVLAFIWNLEHNRYMAGRKIRDLYEPYDRDTPQYYRMRWRACFDTAAYKELFLPQEEWQTEWGLGMTEDALVDRILSKSYLTEAYLSGKEREDFIQKLREAIRTSDKPWVDKEKGIFEFRYSTDVVIMRRRS